MRRVLLVRRRRALQVVLWRQMQVGRLLVVLRDDEVRRRRRIRSLMVVMVVVMVRSLRMMIHPGYAQVPRIRSPPRPESNNQQDVVNRTNSNHLPRGHDNGENRLALACHARIAIGEPPNESWELFWNRNTVHHYVRYLSRICTKPLDDRISGLKPTDVLPEVCGPMWMISRRFLPIPPVEIWRAIFAAGTVM